MHFFQVDAFAEGPFRGNPAAVCLVERPLDDRYRQALAAEMNLSETAFLEPIKGEDVLWNLRWFTPGAEVALCGHATLAAAHVLFEQGLAGFAATLRFDTRSGELSATRLQNGNIELDFPAFESEPAILPDKAAAALGVHAVHVSESQDSYFLELKDESSVRDCKPDMAPLREFEGKRFCITAPAEAGRVDFVSRYFAPALGVDEDPVTGSAHSSLGTIWGRKLGKRQLVAQQISRRGGRLLLDWQDDRMRIAGRAITVLDGTVLI